MENEESKKVYFIRHNPDGQSLDRDKEIKFFEAMKKKSRFGIFYRNLDVTEIIENLDYSGDTCKFKENNIDVKIGKEIKKDDNKGEVIKNSVKNYKPALERMWEIGKNGGIVVVEYNWGDLIEENKKYSGCILGTVKKKAKKIESFEFDGTKCEATLEFTGLKILSYADYPVMLAVRPPFLTICVPRSSFFEKVIPAIAEDKLDHLERKINENTNDKIKLLHPKMLEQLCLEYLRMEGVKGQKLKYCILRPGKSLAKIDIAGISDTDGTIIYAQIKANKINDIAHTDFYSFIRGISNKCLGIIFCEEAGTVNSQHLDDIEYIDIKTVFNFFNTTDEGKKMIKLMIGFPS